MPEELRAKLEAVLESFGYSHDGTRCAPENTIYEYYGSGLPEIEIVVERKP